MMSLFLVFLVSDFSAPHPLQGLFQKYNKQMGWGWGDSKPKDVPNNKSQHKPFSYTDSERNREQQNINFPGFQTHSSYFSHSTSRVCKPDPEDKDYLICKEVTQRGNDVEEKEERIHKNNQQSFGNFGGFGKSLLNDFFSEMLSPFHQPRSERNHDGFSKNRQSEGGQRRNLHDFNSSLIDAFFFGIPPQLNGENMEQTHHRRQNSKNRSRQVQQQFNDSPLYFSQEPRQRTSQVYDF